MSTAELAIGESSAPAVTPLPVEPAPLAERASIRAKGPLRRVRSAYREATAAGRVLPDVLIIGAQKAGTTSLHEYITGHPRVASAVVKEVHYFDLNHHRGLDWYRARFPRAATLRQLEREHGAPALACEGSPYYMAHPLVPYRVRGDLPNVKLIAALRDPVDRALSHHNHEVEMGHEQLPFEAAIEAEEERLEGELARLRSDPTYVSHAHQHHSYLHRGYYAEQLEVWLSLFAREQLLVLDSAALARDPEGTMRRVWAFLGVPFHPAAVYRGVGTRRYRQPDDGAYSALAARFAPHNERLFNLIGERFDWRTA